MASNSCVHRYLCKNVNSECVFFPFFILLIAKKIESKFTLYYMGEISLYLISGAPVLPVSVTFREPEIYPIISQW